MAIERDGEVLRTLRAVFEAGSVAGLSDRQLLERVADRDDAGAEPAFAALVERHGPMVLRVCRSRLADPHDADDAFQAVFCLLASRAGTLWVRDSIGPWLFGVALRVAASTRAEAIRRRAFERRYAEASPRIASEDRPDDLAPMLLEEVGRLPERYRSAVVLCDLEGLTHGEAARRLGWPVGTVKSRQARGRDRLRRRLVLRGLAPSAVGTLAPLLSPRSALAAVPRPLADRAVRLAIQSAPGATSASGLALFSGVWTMMTTHRIATLAAGLLLLGGAAIGAATLARQDDDVRPGRAPRQPPAEAPIARAVQLPRVDDYMAPDGELGWLSPVRDTDDVEDWQAPPVPEAIPVTASGTAIDTAKRPVAGATVFLMNGFIEPRILARTTTNRDGSYRFDGVEVPVVEIPGQEWRPEHSPYACFLVVATCPGYGTSWSFQRTMYAIDPPHPLDIQGHLPLGEPVTQDLTFRPADALHGTVVDEAGRPREGILVSVWNIDLLDVLGQETSRNFNNVRGALPDGLGRDTTGPDGRFRIDGLPSEACCWLRVEDAELGGFGVALFAATTERPIKRHPRPRRSNGRRAHDVYAGDLSLTLPTPRFVRVRTVGDDSGEPIAGVRVNVETESPAVGLFSYGTSDADGVLTLAVPPGTYREISADPPRETPYLRSNQVPFVVAPEPAEQPYELRVKAGAELIIDAVDAEGGEPLRDAMFWLVPTEDPSQTKEIMPPTPGGSRPWTNSEGRLRIVLRPEPDREYRIRFAGFRQPNSSGYYFPVDPSSPDRPRYEVDPPESEPFILRAGETVRLRFTIRPVEE